MIAYFWRPVPPPIVIPTQCRFPRTGAKFIYTSDFRYRLQSGSLTIKYLTKNSYPPFFCFSVGEESLPSSSGQGSVRSSIVQGATAAGGLEDQVVPRAECGRVSPICPLVSPADGYPSERIGWRPRSPPPSSSTDQRMQFMIANELLATELHYVDSLHYVIHVSLVVAHLTIREINVYVLQSLQRALKNS